MSAVDLTVNCAGMINGRVVTVEGKGLGSVERGTLAMDFEFSSIPEGFSVWCASLWTACCSTPTFAIEQNGALNMLSLSNGRYQCHRTFDFGAYGSYDYSYEIRLAETRDTMTATGVLSGQLDLPKIAGVKESFVEMMVPVSSGEVRSFSQTVFEAENGSEIPVAVQGRYAPLSEDDVDWTCCATNQIRSSFIDIIEVDGPKLSLEYSTVIKGVDAPGFPRRSGGVAASVSKG